MKRDVEVHMGDEDRKQLFYFVAMRGEGYGVKRKEKKLSKEEGKNVDSARRKTSHVILRAENLVIREY